MHITLISLSFIQITELLVSQAQSFCLFSFAVISSEILIVISVLTFLLIEASIQLARIYITPCLKAQSCLYDPLLKLSAQKKECRFLVVPGTAIKNSAILDKSGTAAYTKQQDAEAGKVSLT